MANYPLYCKHGVIFPTKSNANTRANGHLVVWKSFCTTIKIHLWNKVSRAQNQSTKITKNQASAVVVAASCMCIKFIFYTNNICNYTVQNNRILVGFVGKNFRYSIIIAKMIEQKRAWFISKAINKLVNTWQSCCVQPENQK